MKIKVITGDWKHARLFLDTSALLKWIYPEFKEKGTENLKNYIEIGMRCSTSEHCIGELLGILKRKKDSKKESPNFKIDNYLQAISFLNYKIDNNRIDVQSIKLSEKFHEISNLVRKYKVDYIDASLAVFFRDSSKNDLFVTADKKLSKLAAELGIAYWYIIDSESPT